MDLVKSPLNYVGGKYKLLKQILPLFPSDIDKFLDVFGGGFNVGANVKTNEIIYNDTETHVCKLLKYLYQTETEIALEQIHELINKYNLSKENAEGFSKLREDYNNNRIKNEHIAFYTMICYAFNYQIRFNQQGKYNMPFGKNRSSFNPSLEKKFIAFVNKIKEKQCQFLNFDYSVLLNQEKFKLTTNDLVYLDPPYFNSVASYNENGGWTEENEKELLRSIDELDKKGIKFALSNNLKYENNLLTEWIDKYNVHYLRHDYTNCNYQKKDKTRDIEILITNY